MHSEAERLTEVLKYIKNIAVRNKDDEDIKDLRNALWRINNITSNTLDVPYEEMAE